METKGDLYEIEFKIGEIFKKDDDLSRHILRLFAVFNDIMMVWTLHLEEKNRKREDSNNRGLYFIRLLASHLKEALETLNRANKNKAFRKLIEDIPLEDRNKVLDKSYQYNEHKLSSIKMDILRPIRNCFFHYMKDEDLEKILAKKKEDTSKIILGDCFKDVYFQVWDELVLEHLKKLMGDKTEPFGQALEDIATTSHSMMEFINKILTKFYFQYMDGKCKRRDK